jgi:hypothetical protein
MNWDSLRGGHYTCTGRLFLMYDLKIVDRISHAEIRNILLKYKIKWRKSKTVLSNKRNNDLAEYDLKKSISNS